MQTMIQRQNEQKAAKNHVKIIAKQHKKSYALFIQHEASNGFLHIKTLLHYVALAT